MSTWQSFIEPGNRIWSEGVCGYAAERIEELTAVCVSAISSDSQVRAAQAGIAELHLLLDLPKRIRSTAEINAAPARRSY